MGARQSRAQHILVLGALLAICGLVALDLALWLQADQLPGRSICCDMSSEGVRAVARAARAEDDDVRLGEVVAAELAALVARKLSTTR